MAGPLARGLAAHDRVLSFQEHLQRKTLPRAEALQPMSETRRSYLAVNAEAIERIGFMTQLKSQLPGAEQRMAMTGRKTESHVSRSSLPDEHAIPRSRKSRSADESRSLESIASRYIVSKSTGST